MRAPDEPEDGFSDFDFDAFDFDWSTSRDAFDRTDPYLELLSGLLDKTLDARDQLRPSPQTRQTFEDMMENSRAREDPFATAITIENEIE